MGRRTRELTETMANLAVTVLGVAGFLGFLVAARMDDANSSPFDVFAFAWFFIFGAIKACLPWFYRSGPLRDVPRATGRSAEGGAFSQRPGIGLLPAVALSGRGSWPADKWKC